MFFWITGSNATYPEQEHVHLTICFEFLVMVAIMAATAHTSQAANTSVGPMAEQATGPDAYLWSREVPRPGAQEGPQRRAKDDGETGGVQRGFEGGFFFLENG